MLEGNGHLASLQGSRTTKVDTESPRRDFRAQTARSVTVHMSCINPDSELPLCIERFGLQDGHCIQGGDGLSNGTVPELQVATLCRHKCTAIAHSTWGIPTNPLTAPQFRVVREEKL